MINAEYLRKCDMEQRFRAIFAGSCEPGCDLEAAIKLGLVERREADRQVMMRYPAVSTVIDLARSERDYIRANDI